MKAGCVWALNTIRHGTAGGPPHLLETHEVIVNLIANTKTSKGLTIQADLNMNSYAKGIKRPDKEMKRLKMTSAANHGEWNYSFSPRNTINKIYPGDISQRELSSEVLNTTHLPGIYLIFTHIFG